MTRRLLNEIYNSEKEILILFTGQHCGHCNQVKPLVEKFGEDNKSLYFEVNVDSSEIDDMFEIEYVPTLVILKEGQYIKYVGVNKINKIINEFN